MATTAEFAGNGNDGMTAGRCWCNYRLWHLDPFIKTLVIWTDEMDNRTNDQCGYNRSFPYTINTRHETEG